MTGSQRGFTLLEVLIAATLLGLVMTALVASMRTFGNTRATIEQVTGRIDEVRTVSGFLRGAIGAALPLERPEIFRDIDSDVPSNATFFQGSSEELVWVSPVVAGSRLGGAYAIQLAREQDKLVMRWHPYRMDISEQAWSDLPARTLLDAVDAFEVAYLPDYGQAWEEAWEPQVSSPAAVRLTIQADGRFWPDLVIRLSGTVQE